MSLNDRESRLRALSDAMRAFAEATADYQKLLGIVAERMSSLIGEGCMVFVLSDDQKQLLPASIYFQDASDQAKAEQMLKGAPIEVDGGTLGGWVVRTGKAKRFPRLDPATVARELSPGYAEVASRMGVRSLMSLPLQIRGRVIGIFSLMRVKESSPPFDEEDEGVALNLAEHAALAISNAQLLESLQRELVERERAEEEAGRFIALIQHSGQFIAMASLDGSILFVNEPGRRLLGLGPDQDLSQLRLKDFHTEDGMKRASIIREKGRWEGQGQLRHFITGELIDTQVSSFLVRDTRGEPFCYATVQHDMRETRRLEAQLKQAQKMEAIGTLAGAIAHDFNNVLGAILGNVELARMELGQKSGVVVESLDEIGKAGRRAKTLIRQILSFSRQRETAKRVIRLADVVLEVRGLLRSTLPANVTVVTAFSDGAPNVLADTTEIHQVVLNLCTNAWHAMEGRGGRLEIALDAVALEADASPLPPGRYARLTVKDDGCGMDAATVERIFDPFFTTKAPGVGTGLGLSVVHGIIKDHAGTINVRSKLGEGSSFEVLLPEVSRPVDVLPPETRELPRGQGQRVLYLDDEEPLVKLTTRLLTRLGFRVTGFTRADEALEAVRLAPNEFDLVLTDFNMPGISGLQVAKLLTAIRPDLPVLLVSGYVSDELKENAAQAGVRQVIYKPNTVEELCDAVHRFVQAGATATSSETRP